VHLAQLIFVFSAYRLDPDPHHDGVIYGAAVGASQGLIPHKDFFSQYGPMQPLVNGLWLKLFGTSMLHLRVFYCVLLVACAWLVYSLLKKYLSTELSLLIPTAWILTGPFGLPWPSILSTFLALISIKLFEKAILNPRNRLSVFVLIFSSGMSVGLSVFVRIHILILGLLMITLLIVLERTRTLSKNIVIYWVLGFVGSIGIVFAYLIVTNALKYYIYQSIVWPANFYAKPNFTKSYIVNWLWYPATLIVILIAFYLIKIYFDRSHSNFKFITTITISTAVFVSSYYISIQDKTGSLTLRNPNVLSITFADRLIHSIGYVTASLVIFITIYFIVKRNKTIKRSMDPFRWVYLVYGLGVFGQLYPLYDNYHLWMISPIFLLTSAILIPKIVTEHGKLAIKSILISLILALCVQQVEQLRIPRYSYKSEQLRGMESSWISAKGTDLTLLKLEDIKNKIKYNCGNGLYAAANGKYQSQDRDFYVRELKSGMESKFTEYVFFCHSTRTAYGEYLKQGWEKSFEIPISIYFEGTTKVYWNVLLKNSKFLQ
jgi:hypothetical protein